MKKINFNLGFDDVFSDGNTAANALAKKVGNKPCVVSSMAVSSMFRCDTAEARKIIIDAMEKNANIIFVP